MAVTTCLAKCSLSNGLVSICSPDQGRCEGEPFVPTEWFRVNAANFVAWGAYAPPRVALGAPPSASFNSYIIPIKSFRRGAWLVSRQPTEPPVEESPFGGAWLTAQMFSARGRKLATKPWPLRRCLHLAPHSAFSTPHFTLF
jgi:hypothetical protein